MADEYDRVDIQDDGDQLPTDGGDWNDDSDVVTGDQQARIDYVPKQDLDNLRKIEQSKLTTYQRQVEQERQEQTLRIEKIERQSLLTERWTQEYIQQGVAPDRAFREARAAAARHVEQEFQQRQMQQQLEQYKERDTVQQSQADIQNLTQSVMHTFGLTEAQLREATKGITRSTPNLRDEVWQRAAAYAKTAGKQGTAATARQLRDNTPFINGSTPARAQYQELPSTVTLGTRGSGSKFMESQKRERRRQRGRG